MRLSCIYWAIDHERLTYEYAGRHFRLTDVHGRVCKGSAGLVLAFKLERN